MLANPLMIELNTSEVYVRVKNWTDGLEWTGTVFPARPRPWFNPQNHKKIKIRNMPMIYYSFDSRFHVAQASLNFVV